MAFCGEAEAVPEPGTGHQAEASMGICGGGGSAADSDRVVVEEERPVGAAETTSHDRHEAVAPPGKQQAARMSTSWEEELLPAAAAAKEEGDGGQESAREKLKRHRLEMAGKVWVPEMWGQEKLLNGWMDCAAFDRPLVPAGLLTARRALVAEACKRRRQPQPPPPASSSPLRVVQNGCS